VSSIPKISVVMPVYNGEKLLREAIQSILAQTFRDFELLICDDGSTDNTHAVAEEFVRADTRVRLVKSQHIGLEKILNLGLQEAQGEFIARMDADDIALPDRFTKQIEFLQNHPEVVAVGGQVVVIDETGLPLHVWNMPQEHREIDDNHICGRNVAIVHPTVMMRRAAVSKAGGYRGRVEDIDLWLRLAEQGKLANLPDVVLKYRRISTSYSAGGHGTAAEFTKVATEARLRRGLPLDKLEMPIWTRTNGGPETRPSSYSLLSDRCHAHFVLGEKREARRCAMKMLLLRPFSRQSIGFARQAFLAR
jgi:glycosyltransferase involved in cell wall biosynthesis